MAWCIFTVHVQQYPNILTLTICEFLLLEHLVNEWSSPSDCWNPSKVIDKVESMIEKEKEQIMNAYLKGDNNGCGCYDFSTPIDARNYYNETFNQNK